MNGLERESLGPMRRATEADLLALRPGALLCFHTHWYVVLSVRRSCGGDIKVDVEAIDWWYVAPDQPAPVITVTFAVNDPFREIIPPESAGPEAR